MANKPLKSIQFPGLSDAYTVPQVDNTLAVAGDAADAKKTGDEISELKQELTQKMSITNDMLTEGYFCGDTGMPSANANFTISEYIDISGCVEGCYIKAPCSLRSGAGICITDVTGKALSSIIGNTASSHGYSNNYTGFVVMQIPNGAKYIRTSFYNSEISLLPNKDIEFLQISDLIGLDVFKDNLNSVENSTNFASGNLWDCKYANWTGFYDKTGTFQTNSGYPSSDFIDVSDYDYVSVSAEATAMSIAYIADFWTSAKVFISGEQNNKAAEDSFSKIWTVPDNAKYFTVNTRVVDAQIQPLTVTGHKKNPILQLSDVITKGLNGKKISILGDSISTYTGYNPVGNEVYYTGSNCGVSSVEQTWWKRVINHCGLSLCVNESWSGATISSIRDVSYPNSSGVARCENLNDGTTNPDIIIIYMGTNDFRWDVPIGSYDGSQTFPTTWGTFKDAIAIMLKKVLEKYKTSVVYICTLKQFESYSNTDEGFPDTNNLGLTIDDYSTAIIEMSTLFGIPVIDFNKSGLNYFNLSEYAGDYNSGTGKALHPNSAGMKKLADRAIHDIIGEFTNT